MKLRYFYFLFLVFLIGCSFGPSPKTSSDLNKSWSPESAPSLPALPEKNSIPEELREHATQLTLPELIDMALRHNDRTKIAWLRARSAAAAYVGAKSAFYPQIRVGAELEKNKSPFANPRTDNSVSDNFRTLTGKEVYGPYADLSWLVFDFGKREATVDQFRASLIAANYGHNSELQKVIYDVINSFYNYVRLKALAKAQDQSLAEAMKNVDYAKQRHEAGVVTIADVLQAKTAAAKAKFARQATEGQIQSIRGLVATAVGLAPDAPFEAAPVALESLPVTRIASTVEQLIDAAEADNPALLSIRAKLVQATAAYKAQSRRSLPSISTGWRPEKKWSEGDSDQGFSVNVRMEMPLFTGWGLSSEIEQADYQREIAESEMNDTAKTLALQVWNDYFAIKTAEQQVETSKELLESAQASYDVAEARYREGVGTILDLLTADSALLDARSSTVDARTAWLIAVAALARDTGKLIPGDNTIIESFASQGAHP